MVAGRRLVRFVWGVGLTVLALSVAADFLVPKSDGPWWSHRGAFAALGFVGCLAIVIISKQLGRWWIERPEHYYRRDAD